MDFKHLYSGNFRVQSARFVFFFYACASFSPLISDLVAIAARRLRVGVRALRHERARGRERKGARGYQ